MGMRARVILVWSRKASLTRGYLSRGLRKMKEWHHIGFWERQMQRPWGEDMFEASGNNNGRNGWGRRKDAWEEGGVRSSDDMGHSRPWWGLWNQEYGKCVAYFIFLSQKWVNFILCCLKNEKMKRPSIIYWNEVLKTEIDYRNIKNIAFHFCMSV